MLPLEEKIGQMMMVGFEGLEAPDYLLKWLAAGRIGGIILFARNIASPQQVAELVSACHKAAKYPLLVSIDQEGGTVARLRDGFSESPGAMALGAANSDELAERVSATMAAELRALGVNWNLAPVVDLTHDISNPSVGTRSLGRNPERVAQLVAAEVRGFQKAGVAATAKHFPGIGNTPIDTHLAQAIITEPADYLWNHDLIPFRGAVDAGVETVMVGHVTFQSLDAEHPSTLSAHVIQGLLRDDIGFKGLVCSDCMEMRAISDHYTSGETAILAALAGEDMILFSHTRGWQEAAYKGLLEAIQSGRVPEELIVRAVERVMSLKQRYAITSEPALDIIRRPEHLALMQEAAQRGLVLVQAEKDLLPVHPNQRVALVEFASVRDSLALDEDGLTGFATLLTPVMPTIERVTLGSDSSESTLARAQHTTAEADVLLLITRNAHLAESQRRIAQNLLDQAKQSILVCLRNPYDAAVLHGATMIICSCGDSIPSMQAVVDALMGQFRPDGHLTSNLSY
jgi:beta-N-acetylhexosaminidase